MGLYDASPESLLAFNCMKSDKNKGMDALMMEYLINLLLKYISSYLQVQFVYPYSSMYKMYISVSVCT